LHINLTNFLICGGRCKYKYNIIIYDYHEKMYKYPRYVFDSYIGSKWVCFVVMKFGVPTILYRGNFTIET